ncbi:MAG: HK97 gp10 family phage protein [bacterium]|nr:HK97 gp10 family phage protein [bacterium]
MIVIEHKVDEATVRQVRRRLAEITEDTKTAFARALNVSAAHIAAEATKITPIDTGRLRNSQVVKFATPDDLTAEIGYGGPTVGYAEPVHERLDLRHTPPTQAKFLSEPFEAEVATWPDGLVERFQRFWGE